MLHNLLTSEDKKRLRHEYIMRLMIVCGVLVSIAFGIGVVSLFPTYLELAGILERLETESLAITLSETSTNQNSEEHQALEKVQSIVTLYEGVLDQLNGTDLITQALLVRGPSITVDGIQYDKAKHTMRIEGVAATRDALLTYASALNDLPLFGSVPVSISNLAKQTDIPFNLSVPIEEGLSLSSSHEDT